MTKISFLSTEIELRHEADVAIFNAIVEFDMREAYGEPVEEPDFFDF